MTHSTRPPPRLSCLAVLALLACAPLGCDKGGADKPDAKKAADEGDKTAKTEDAKTDGAKAADGTKPDAEAEANPAAKPGEGLDREGADAKKAEAKAKFENHDAAKVRDAKSKMLATLNQGRKLVKEGKLDEGMAKYKELLAIDPNYGPALGELGWAEFKAGKYEEAKAHTMHALTRARDDKRRGMLHYNLGRIAEAQGKTEVAIEAYALSLSFRPNEVVANRLAEISHVEDAAGTAVEHPAVEEYRQTHAKGSGAQPVLLGSFEASFPTIEAACAEAKSACAWEDTECEFHAHDKSTDASWGLVYAGEPIMNCWYPIVQHEGGWTLYESVLLGQYGSEVDQAVDSFATRVETNAAGTFLIIEYSDHLYERDWSWGELEEDEEIPDDDSYDSEGLIICKQGAPSVCTQPIPTKYEAWFGDNGHQRYSAKVSLDGDTIVVEELESEGGIEYATRENEWDLVPPLPPGKYAFAELREGD